MIRNRTNFLRLASAICGFALCAAVLMPIAAPARPNAESPAEKSTKVKSTKANRSKKSTADTSQSNVPGSKSKAPPTQNASAAEIQSAKSSGEVWVNTDTGVYHKSGKWYGATKNGKFMPEQEAVKSGYRAAKNEK